MEFLVTLHSLYKEDNNQVKASILDLITRSEQRRHTYLRIGHCLTSHTEHVPITSLDVPSADGWQTITDPQEIEDLLIAQNIKHFSQAHRTPFTVAPLSHHYDSRASKALDKSVVDSILQDKNVDDVSKQFLIQIVKQTKPTIFSNISKIDLINGYKTWDRNTTTYPSGRHLDHYKAILPHPTISSPTAFWNIHTTILNNCIRTNSTLSRWHKITTLMIKKDIDSTRIDWLRVIHIIEADYNLLLKITISCTLMNFLENTKSISNQQFGSRKYRSAQDAAFTNTLYREHLHLLRLHAIEVNYDAKACYN